jgi:probable HAF family extracellular repeat protein
MFGNHKKKVSSLAAHRLILPLLVITPCAWGQTYTAVDLGPATVPLDVTSTGQVVGLIQTIDGYDQPFITVDGNIKALDALHGDDTARVVAANASGVSAGYSCLGENPGCSAVTWVAGGTPTAFASGFEPTAINDAGEIIGQLYESNSTGLGTTTNIAIWRKGVFSALPLFPLPADSHVGGNANAINSAGLVAGEISWENSNLSMTTHAVVWDGSTIQDLGTNASAQDLNDHGQVVGYSGNDAALWTNGVLTDLGNLGGGFTCAYGINNSGIIVGTAELPFNGSAPADNSAALVWISGVMYQLADLIKPKLPGNIYLELGQAINDSGQILASGFDTVDQKYHSYILSPEGVVPGAAAPTFSVLPRTYTTTQTVTIADVTPTATIQYTLDGTTPTTQSPIYTAPLKISETTSLKAIAVATSYLTSAVAEADYTIVAPASASTPLNLSSVANVQAIGPLGTRAHVGLDGYRNVYASELMGNSLYWSGVQFDFVDSTSTNGVAAVTLPLPAGQYSALKLLGTSSDGNRSAETFVVTYTDGTSSTIVQGMSDWLTPQAYPGESTALSMDHRIAHSGTASAGPYHLYGYTLNLNPAKTVRSLTLPASKDVVVLAGALMATSKS